MGAVRFVLSSALLGFFFCWGFSWTVATTTNDGICVSSFCICDPHERLTCDCKGEQENLILTSEGENHLSPHTSRIQIRDCSSVTLMNSSLAEMTGLRSIEFLNITNLTLFTKSFEMSPKATRTIVSIRSSNIDVLPSFTFRGDMETISFENVEINLVNSFAFANLAGTDTLRLEDCRFENIEEQAFKKFDVNYLHIIRGSFGSQVPSRALNDIEVLGTFRLDGVQMGIVRSSAFVIKKPKTVSIQNCIFGSLEAEAFDIITRGAVLIKNNTFESLAAGTFMGIHSDHDDKLLNNKLLDLTFTNNTLENFEEGSVLFDRGSFRPDIDNVFINKTCDCDSLKVWKENFLNYSNVYTRFSNILVQSKNLDPIEEGTFLCLNQLDNFESFKEFKGHNCAIRTSMLFFLFSSIGIVFLSVVIVGLIIWACKVRQGGQKRWMSVPTSAPDVVVKKNGIIGKRNSTPSAPVDSRITMVVPDGRLYRETEFHVIVEKAEPLTTEL